jgi:hypothetical protein
MVMAASLVLSGCLTLDAKLTSSGEATIKMSYRVEKESLPKAKQDLEGPHVTVKSADWADGRATFDLAVDDVQKISTSKAFSHTAVALRDGKTPATKELVVTLRQDRPMKLEPEVIDKLGKEMHLSIELPGEIVSSNATSTKGAVATWTISTEDFAAKPETVLNVVYKTATKDPQKKT